MKIKGYNDQQAARLLIAASVVGVIPPGGLHAEANRFAVSDRKGLPESKLSVARKTQAHMASYSAKIIDKIQSHADSYFAARVAKKCADAGLPVPQFDLNWKQIIMTKSFAATFAADPTGPADVEIAKGVGRDMGTEIIKQFDLSKTARFMV
jgi:hypothetical protein